MSEQHLDAELNTLAEALRTLKPSPAALNRDALMFRAGQAAAPRGWRWPLATAAATLLATGLGSALLIRPAQPVVEHTVYVEVTAPVAPPPAPPAALVSHETDLVPHTAYQRLQDQLLRKGFDGLPPLPSSPPQETRDSLLRSL